MMFESDGERARTIAKERKGLVLSAWIDRVENGKYKLTITVAHNYDDLTIKIFKKEENGKWKYSLRNVIQQGTNYFYEEADDKTDVYEETFNTYEDAYNKLQEILTTIKNTRDKVRVVGKKFSSYVII